MANFINKFWQKRKTKISAFLKRPAVIFGIIVLVGISLVTWRVFAAGTTYTWTNAGGDNLWTNKLNWSPNTALPGSADTVIFSASSTADCNIAANVNVSSFSIQSGYIGTITQTSSYTFTTAAFSQANGNLILNSTSFSQTGGAVTMSGGTFTATGSISFANNLTLSGTAFTAGSGTMTVSGAFSQSSGTFRGGTGSMTFNSTYAQSAGTSTFGTGGYVRVASDFTQTGGLFDASSSPYLYFVGNFTLSGASSVFNAPSIGIMYVWGNWTHTAGGTFNNDGGTVSFGDNWTFGSATVNGSETFNNLLIFLFMIVL